MSLNFGPQWMRKIPASSPDQQSSLQLQPLPQQQQEHSTKDRHESQQQHKGQQNHPGGSGAAFNSKASAAPIKSAWATGRPNLTGSPPTHPSNTSASVALGHTRQQSLDTHKSSPSKQSHAHHMVDTPKSAVSKAISSDPTAIRDSVLTSHTKHLGFGKDPRDAVTAERSEPNVAASLQSNANFNQTSNPFSFSRDVILGLFRDLNMLKPADFDETLGCFVKEGRDPLANVPLSEHEKKLLSMSSINSEAPMRRPNSSYRQDTLKNTRNGGMGQDMRGGRRGMMIGGERNFADRVRARDPMANSAMGMGLSEAQHPDELWDTPTSLGSFASGVFGGLDKRGMDNNANHIHGNDLHNDKFMMDDEMAKLAFEEERLRQMHFSQRPNSPLRMGSRSKFDDGHFGLSNASHSGMLLDPSDALNQQHRRNSPSGNFDFEGMRDIGSTTSPALMRRSHSGMSSAAASNLHHTGPMPSQMFNEAPAFMPGSLAMPGFQFVPPQWVYKDPSGVLRGPFTSEQMHNWYKDGYFPENLPIKCVEDPLYIALSQFVERYGQQAPFLESLMEQEQLEKMFFLRQMQQRRWQVSGMPGASALGLGELAGGNPGELRMQPPPHTQLADGGQHDINSLAHYISVQMDVLDDAAILHLPALASIPIQQRIVLITEMRHAKAGQQYQMMMQQQRQQELAQQQQSIGAGRNALNTDAGLINSSGNTMLRDGRSDSSSPKSLDDKAGALKSPKEHSASPSVSSFLEVNKAGDFQIETEVLSDPVSTPKSPEHLHTDVKPVESKQSSPSRRQSKPKESAAVHFNKNTAEPAIKEETAWTSAPAVSKKSEKRKKSNADMIEQTVEAAVESPTEQAPIKEKSAPWAACTESQESVPGKTKLSLKQIQEAEQREFEERERRRVKDAQLQIQQMVLQEQQAAATGVPAQSTWANNSSPWKVNAATKTTAPKAGPVAHRKSLAEIMKDESKRKTAEVLRQAEMVATTDKRYADSAATGVSSLHTTGASWGSSGSKVPAVVATGPVLKPVMVPAQTSSHISHISTTSADGGAWNVVGKQTSAPSTGSRPTLQSPSSTLASARVSQTPSQATNGSAALVQWCRVALRGVQRTSTTVNVDEFITMLNSINVKESATITMICDDTLGGSTAIDPRKFADEYIRRRQAEASGTHWSAQSSAESDRHPNLTILQPVAAESEWSTVPVGKGEFVTGDSLDSFADKNKFVIKSNKKKNKK
ncbi:hypothetical protein BDV3_001246 [Batrachochytrium dendrobatidis]